MDLDQVAKQPSSVGRLIGHLKNGWLSGRLPSTAVDDPGNQWRLCDTAGEQGLPTLASSIR
jgi:hypothetical protein